jgi:SAM-dependent methyltransferase
LALMAEPYHRFVYDTERRAFVGAFEDMYAAEDAEGFDAWHQEDLSTLPRQVALGILRALAPRSALDFGCGKGAVSAFLARAGADVVGLDVSPTAVAKARERVPGARFEAGGLDALGDERFDLAVAMEVLSLIEDWRGALAGLAERADRLFVTLWLPPDPIGFVKSFDELRDALRAVGTIEHDVVVDGDQVMAVVSCSAVASSE